MDAETRHALKQNELAEALEHVSDWSSKPAFRNTILVVALALAAFVAYRFWSSSSRSAANAAWAEVYAAQRSAGESPETALASLKETIQSTADADLAAAARLISANILMNNALDAPALIETNGPQIPELLQPVVSNTSLAPQYRAPAQFLIARAQESLNQLDEARKTYTAIAENAAYAGMPYPKLAKDRLNLLEGLTQLPVLTPGSPPTASAPSAPPVPRPGWEPMGAEDIAPPTAPPVGPTSSPPSPPPPAAAETPSDAPARDAPAADEPAAEPTEPPQP